MPTPPVLLMTPDGEVVGEVSNYASADTVLKQILAVLDEHPGYAGGRVSLLNRIGYMGRQNPDLQRR